MKDIEFECRTQSSSFDESDTMRSFKSHKTLSSVCTYPAESCLHCLIVRASKQIILELVHKLHNSTETLLDQVKQLQKEFDEERQVVQKRAERLISTFEHTKPDFVITRLQEWHGCTSDLQKLITEELRETSELVFQSTQGTFELYNTAFNTKVVKTLSASNEAKLKAVDQLRVAFYDPIQSTITVESLNSGEILCQVHLADEEITAMAFKNNKVAVGLKQGRVIILNLLSRAIQFSFWDHSSPVNALALNENQLVSASHDKKLRFYDLHSGNLLNVLDTSQKIVSMQFHKDLLAFSCEDLHTKVVDCNDWSEIFKTSRRKIKFSQRISMPIALHYPVLAIGGSIVEAFDLSTKKKLVLEHQFMNSECIPYCSARHLFIRNQNGELRVNSII